MFRFVAGDRPDERRAHGRICSLEDPSALADEMGLTRTARDPARPRTWFVGRERELAEIASLLTSGERLVSLVGIGGVGIARPALRVAGEID